MGITFALTGKIPLCWNTLITSLYPFKEILNAKCDTLQHSSCQTGCTFCFFPLSDDPYEVFLPSIICQNIIHKLLIFFICSHAILRMTRQTLDCAEFKADYVRGHALLPKRDTWYPFPVPFTARRDVLCFLFRMNMTHTDRDLWHHKTAFRT